MLDKKNHGYHVNEIDKLVDFKEGIIRTHPISGKEAIMLSERYIKSLDHLHYKTDDIIKMINDHHNYDHAWRAGDLLIWDNYSVLHKGLASSKNGVKVTHRTVVD